MHVEYLSSAIGKQADSDAVAKLLKEFGFESRVAIKRDETDVYLNNQEAGVSLLFESEQYIHAKHGVELPTDAPVLTAIFLYGPDDDEFSEYKNDLPGGLLFSDDQTIAYKKLGESAKFNSDRGTEYWDFPGNVRIFVRYADNKTSIARMQFGVLWQ